MILNRSPTWSPPKFTFNTPTSPPLFTSTPLPTPTKPVKAATIALGEVTNLGSGSDASTVSVFINGGRLMVYATGFARDAVILPRVRAPGSGWTNLDKFTIQQNTSLTYGMDLPAEVAGQSPLEVCLRNTRTSDQNCYSVSNIQ